MQAERRERGAEAPLFSKAEPSRRDYTVLLQNDQDIHSRTRKKISRDPSRVARAQSSCADHVWRLQQFSRREDEPNCESNKVHEATNAVGISESHHVGAVQMNKHHAKRSNQALNYGELNAEDLSTLSDFSYSIRRTERRTRRSVNFEGDKTIGLRSRTWSSQAILKCQLASRFWPAPTKTNLGTVSF